MNAKLICWHRCIGNLALLRSDTSMSLVSTWISSKWYYCNAQNLQPQWAAVVPCIDVQHFDIHERSCELQMEVLTEGQKAG